MANHIDPTAGRQGRGHRKIRSVVEVLFQIVFAEDPKNHQYFEAEAADGETEKNVWEGHLTFDDPAVIHRSSSLCLQNATTPKKQKKRAQTPQGHEQK